MIKTTDLLLAALVLILGSACGGQQMRPVPQEKVGATTALPCPEQERKFKVEEPPEPEPRPNPKVEAAVEARPEPKLVLDSVEFSDLPGWRDDEVGLALPALRKSCARLSKKRDDALVGRDRVGGTVKQWRSACRAAQNIKKNNTRAARNFFETYFRPFLAKNNTNAVGRFTGYYEASLRGSLKRHGRYQFPLYKRPKDLVMVNMRNFTDKPSRRRIAGRVVHGQLRPYETRKEIREGALRGKRLALLWIDNKVDGFFAQIQGSGLVTLESGKHMRIGYAGQNGHSYTAIGRELVSDGQITREQMSMQAIRTWLADNPKLADEMMDRNEAYVFFGKMSSKGPVGSQNVELTPERSVAIDRNFIPQSVPLFIDTVVPTDDGSGARPFRQLLIAQDSGGAIRGPVRADIFWGAGPRATAIAGRLKSHGTYYLLLPTPVASERALAR